MKRTSQNLPVWKKELMLRLRMFIIFRRNSGWRTLHTDFTEDEVLKIVGQAYSITGWVDRLRVALEEREKAGYYASSVYYAAHNFKASVPPVMKDYSIEAVRLYLEKEEPGFKMFLETKGAIKPQVPEHAPAAPDWKALVEGIGPYCDLGIATDFGVDITPMLKGEFE